MLSSFKNERRFFSGEGPIKIIAVQFDYTTKARTLQAFNAKIGVLRKNVKN